MPSMSIWLRGVKPNLGLRLSSYVAKALALLFRFSGRRTAITSSLFFGSVTQSVARIMVRMKRTSSSSFLFAHSRRAESPRIVLDVVFGLGEDFEAALLNLVVGQAHHGA